MLFSYCVAHGLMLMSFGSLYQAGECTSGDYENDGEWTLIGGMRRDAKMSTEEDGGSHEAAQLTLASTEAAGGVPNSAAMRIFFKYGDEYHR